MSLDPGPYRRLSAVELVQDDRGAVMAAVLPGRPELGALSQPEGQASAMALGERWLRSRGCRRALGPMTCCTWFPYRANLGPHRRPPFVFEPTFSPEPWIAAGYREVGRYASALAPNRAFLREARRLGDAASGFRLRPLDLDRFDAEIDRLHAVAVEAFRGALAYTPLPLDAFRAIYSPLRDRLVPSLVQVAEDRAGQVVGFCFSLPEPLAPGRREFVVKSLAVLPGARRGGLGTRLVAACHREAQALGLAGGGIHALMWEGSRSRAISAHGGVIFRRYALYGKDL